MLRLYTFRRTDGHTDSRSLCEKHLKEINLKSGWSRDPESESTEIPCVICVIRDPGNYPTKVEDPPVSRSTDPSTSHQAEGRHNLTARAKRQRQVLQLVSRFPDRTNGEYARLMLQEYPDLPVKVAVETPHKRLSDLFDKKMIMVSGERKCSDSGYNCRTWRITEHGSAQL